MGWGINLDPILTVAIGDQENKESLKQLQINFPLKSDGTLEAEQMSDSPCRSETTALGELKLWPSQTCTVWSQRPTATLLTSILAVVLSSLQIGYHTGNVNAPAKVPQPPAFLPVCRQSCILGQRAAAAWSSSRAWRSWTADKYNTALGSHWKMSPPGLAPGF